MFKKNIAICIALLATNISTLNAMDERGQKRSRDDKAKLSTEPTAKKSKNNEHIPSPPLPNLGVAQAYTPSNLFFVAPAPTAPRPHPIILNNFAPAFPTHLSNFPGYFNSRSTFPSSPISYKPEPLPTNFSSLPVTMDSIIAGVIKDRPNFVAEAINNGQNDVSQGLLISAYFPATPGNTYANMILAPTKRGVGSLGNVNRGFLNFSMPEGLNKPYGAYEIYLVKSEIHNRKARLVCGKLLCNYDGQGFWYHLLPDPTFPNSRQEAEHNVATLKEFQERFYPEPYELMDSHHQVYRNLDRLFVGMQIPQALSQNQKFETCAVIFASTAMMKKTATEDIFAQKFEHALSQAAQEIQVYPSVASSTQLEAQNMLSEQSKLWTLSWKTPALTTRTQAITPTYKKLQKSIAAKKKQGTKALIVNSDDLEMPLADTKQDLCISAFFPTTPHIKYPNMILAPTKGPGSLCNATRGFLNFPMRKGSDKLYGPYEVYLVKSVTLDGKLTLVHGKLLCNYDKKGFWYSLLPNKSLPRSVQEAEHNMATLEEFRERFYPKPYDLMDSHAQVCKNLDKLFVGIQIPQALSQRQEIETCAVLFASTAMLKITALHNDFRPKFREALSRAEQEIQAYPPAKNPIDPSQQSKLWTILSVKPKSPRELSVTPTTETEWRNR